MARHSALRASAATFAGPWDRRGDAYEDPSPSARVLRGAGLGRESAAGRELLRRTRVRRGVRGHDRTTPTNLALVCGPEAAKPKLAPPLRGRGGGDGAGSGGDPKRHAKRTRNAPRTHPERIQNAPETHPERTQNAPRTHPERTQSAPKAHPKCTRNAPRTHPKHTQDAPETHPRPRTPLPEAGLQPQLFLHKSVSDMVLQNPTVAMNHQRMSMELKAGVLRSRTERRCTGNTRRVQFHANQGWGAVRSACGVWRAEWVCWGIAPH